LYERGFPDPEVVCQRYDLRYAPYGEWAARVLFPLTDHGHVMGWTGRAILPTLVPKYRMQDVQSSKGLIYQPRATRPVSVLVEGPIDALKINAACHHLPIAAAALTGLAISDWSAADPARMVRIDNFFQDAVIRLIALDAAVSDAQADRMRWALAEFRGPNYIISRLRIPAPFNDPGAMDYLSIRRWLQAYCTLGDTGYGTPTFPKPPPQKASTT
jgi:hypothetical protein